MDDSATERAHMSANTVIVHLKCGQNTALENLGSVTVRHAANFASPNILQVPFLTRSMFLCALDTLDCNVLSV